MKKQELHTFGIACPDNESKIQIQYLLKSLAVKKQTTMFKALLDLLKKENK
jgi:hypothetical protein